MGFNLTPAGLKGHWGKPTSTLDWCEENYIVSYYIAEFWNSLSNAFYTNLAVLGLFLCYKIGAETRAYLAFLSLFVVGVGSFLFHATLLFETQMMDELPMIYCGCILVYNITLTFPSKLSEKVVGLVLASYGLLVTVLYLYIQNPVFHQVCYALLVSIMVFQPWSQIQHLGKTLPNDASRLRTLYIFSLATYMGGFAIWNFENLNCDALRELRNSVGYPWRPFLELHGWWHLGTGLGTYGSILLQIYLRLHALGRKDISLKWRPLPWISISKDKTE
ncbi:Alkaline ceramidase 3 [Phlyctochytrium bullatum]|nr:Alkaline ceramidase 3 [Phlyctochytrium bullatum]